MSFPVHGAPPKGVWFLNMQRWQIPRDSPVVFRSIGLPASIRKPCLLSVLFEGCEEVMVQTGAKAVTLLTPSYGGI